MKVSLPFGTTLPLIPIAITNAPGTVLILFSTCINWSYLFILTLSTVHAPLCIFSPLTGLARLMRLHGDNPACLACQPACMKARQLAYRTAIVAKRLLDSYWRGNKYSLFTVLALRCFPNPSPRCQCCSFPRPDGLWTDFTFNLLQQHWHWGKGGLLLANIEVLINRPITFGHDCGSGSFPCNSNWRFLWNRPWMHTTITTVCKLARLPSQFDLCIHVLRLI